MKKILAITVSAAAIALSVGIVEPVQAQNGFLSNLFSTQKGRERRAAAAVQRVVNREIQTALNYFEFDAGIVDGVMGQQSRSSIRAYQAYLQFPVTGQLTDEEQSYLLSSFKEIANGSEEMHQRVLANPEGARGVLKVMRLGEVPMDEAPLAPAINVQDSMRSLCVNIGASGPMNLVKAQFCNLRQLSIDQGYVLLDVAPNRQPFGEVMEKCEVFAVAMAPFVVDINSRPSTEIIAEMTVWAASSGMTRDTLSQISKTCLGAAYTVDNTEVVLASLAALAGLNEAEYLELIGYHVAFGLGVENTESPNVAVGWLENAIAALPEGLVDLTGQESSHRAETIIDVINILALQEQ